MSKSHVRAETGNRQLIARHSLLIATSGNRQFSYHSPMNFGALLTTTAMPFVFAGVLLAILVISFRSRSVVFCQYLKRMTGIELKPSEVHKAFVQRGQTGVREMFLDLIIREDLKEGPLEVPDESGSQNVM